MSTRVLPPSPSCRLSPARPHPSGPGPPLAVKPRRQIGAALAGSGSSALRRNTQSYLDHRVRRTGLAVRIARGSAGWVTTGQLPQVQTSRLRTRITHLRSRSAPARHG
jgi:hypothetical protein